MNTYRYILFSLLLSLGLFSSCFDDKGNYDYKEIGEAVIKAIPGVTDNGDKLVCLENDVIRLTPEVEFKAGTSASDYEFIWFRYPKNPAGQSGHYEQADTLAMTQNLEYKVINTPREYWLVYKVRNKVTGALTEQKFEFIISAISGWMVLDENASGKADIQVIRDKDIVDGGDGRIVKDYFSFNNEGKKMENARFMAICPFSSRANLYVYSDAGAYILDMSTYKEKADSYTDLFSSTVTLDQINPQAEHYDIYGGNVEVLVNNYKIYTVAYRMMGQTQFVAASGVDDYTAAPAIAPIRINGSANSAALFDTKNNRFITVGTWGSITAPVSTGGAFNTGAIDPALKFVCMGEGKDGETCMVMRKEDSGEPYLFRASFVETDPVALTSDNLNGLKDIGVSKYYAFGTRGNFMFYATDSKVYTWRYGSESASEFMTVGEGEKIVQIKMYTNVSDATFNGKILFVATQKGNEGKVYKVVFNEMSGVAESSPVEYTGFNIIKDMYYR